MTVAVVLDSRSPTGAVGWNAAARRGRRGREAEEPWLDSAPFRAHVVHVMSASGLSARELAALSRVSVRLIRRLVHGRDGRPVRRIDPLSARRLFGVTALDATLVRSRVVPAGSAAGRGSAGNSRCGRCGCMVWGPRRRASPPYPGPAPWYARYALRTTTCFRRRTAS